MGAWRGVSGPGSPESPQGSALRTGGLSVPPPLTDVSDISHFLSVFQKPHAGVIQAARQLLSDERAPLRQKLLADLLGTVSENIAAETRAEDPPWFEGACWIRIRAGAGEWGRLGGGCGGGEVSFEPTRRPKGSPFPRSKSSPSTEPESRQP